MNLIESIDGLLVEGFKRLKSPLDYHRGGGKVQRIMLVDTSSKKPSTHEYFRDLDASVVGFLDFHKTSSGYYIDYMVVRPDLRRKGYALRLVKEFYDKLEVEASKRRKANARDPLVVDWGKMMQVGIGKLMKAMKDEYPDIYSHGKIWY